MPKTERLYYFTCTKYALEGIQKRRLKATQLDKTNDPFELLACRSESVEGMETEEYFRWRHSLDWRMLCLSKTYKNPLMWGHYADKGKGICLGFDVIIDDGSPVPRAFEVDYQPARVRPDYEPPGLASIPSSLKFWLNTRLVKSRDWAYEKEWRMWVHTHDDLTFDTDKDMYFIPFKNRLTLHKILIGPYCVEHDIDIYEELEKLTTDYPDPKPEIVSTRLSSSAFEIEMDKDRQK